MHIGKRNKQAGIYKVQSDNQLTQQQQLTPGVQWDAVNTLHLLCAVPELQSGLRGALATTLLHHSETDLFSSAFP